MTIELAVTTALAAGLLLLVSTLGLQANAGDQTALLRQPRRLLRSLTSMLVVMPIVATALALAFDLDRAVKIALVALALSPVPPFLPPRVIESGARSSFAIGLLVATALVSIVYVPLALAVLSRIADVPLRVSVTHLVVPIGWTVFLPLVAGLLVKRLAPGFAARAARPIARLASILLLVGLIPLVVMSITRVMPLFGNGTLAAMLVFCLAGLATGHLLGEGTPGDRAMLALATAARHPGVAMVVARTNFPDETLVFPTVVLYVVLAAIVSLPYARWASTRT